MLQIWQKYYLEHYLEITFNSNRAFSEVNAERQTFFCKENAYQFDAAKIYVMRQYEAYIAILSCKPVSVKMAFNGRQDSDFMKFLIECKAKGLINYVSYSPLSDDGKRDISEIEKDVIKRLRLYLLDDAELKLIRDSEYELTGYDFTIYDKLIGIKEKNAYDVNSYKNIFSFDEILYINNKILSDKLLPY